MKDRDEVDGKFGERGWENLEETSWERLIFK